jgi:hypothetical protein
VVAGDITAGVERLAPLFNLVNGDLNAGRGCRSRSGPPPATRCICVHDGTTPELGTIRRGKDKNVFLRAAGTA